MKEIWKDIENFEGLYQISNLARIKRLYHEVEYIRKGKKIKAKFKAKIYDYSKIIRKSEYIIVSLRKNNKKYDFLLHILVAKAFVYNDDVKFKTQVNHLDGNKFNNISINLEWCTPSRNTQHAYDIGLCDNSKLQAHITHGKAVMQFDVNNNLLNEFESVLDASKITGISKYTIYNSCNNKIKRPNPYIWKYKS